MRKASYKKLWKILIDRDMNKQMLGRKASVSSSTLTKMMKCECVNTEILIRICDALDCDLFDIVELVDVVGDDKKNVNDDS